MGYELMGRTHAALLHAWRRAAAAEGQGTVEYVGLVLLLAGLMAVVVTAVKGQDGKGIAQQITDQLKSAIGSPAKAGK